MENVTITGNVGDAVVSAGDSEVEITSSTLDGDCAPSVASSIRGTISVDGVDIGATTDPCP